MGRGKRASRHAAGVSLGVLAFALAAAVSGCTGQGSTITSITPESEVAAPPTPVASPQPGLDLAKFDAVGRAVVAGDKHPLGADFTTALQKAGFPKSAMQLTADRTTLGLKPGSIQFAVLVGDDCFIGQYGTAVGGYHSELAAPLSTGGCLIGGTVPVP